MSTLKLPMVLPIIAKKKIMQRLLAASNIILESHAFNTRVDFILYYSPMLIIEITSSPSAFDGPKEKRILNFEKHASLRFN